MAVSKFKDLLQTGVQAGASDWHIRQGTNAILRIDGALTEVEFTTTKEFLEEAVAQICLPRDMERYADGGDADFAHVEDGVGRFRVNLHRQRNLMSLTFRHIKAKMPSFAELNLSPVIQNIATAERGIILVTGTTGSGKSTTMAAMLEHMNETMSRHVITVEDPIEFHYDDKSCVFEQREVGADTKSFDSALIHALRQDPDVIVVGEMRNRESFDTALTAADTGHLVMSTLHTSNAPQSVQRILDFYEEEERKQIRQSLASNLHAIISQRLVPKKEGKGVVPAQEIMINTPIVRKLLEEDKLDKLPSCIEGGERDGMMSFNQCLFKLIKAGLISEEQALIRSSNPEQLKMNLKGIFLSSSSAIIG